MLKYLFPHLLKSGFTERPPETGRIIDFIILIGELCILKYAQVTGIFTFVEV